MTVWKVLLVAAAACALTVIVGPVIARSSAVAWADDCPAPHHYPAPNFDPFNRSMKPGDPLPVTPCVTVLGLTDPGPPITPEFPFALALPAAFAAGLGGWWLLRRRRLLTS